MFENEDFSLDENYFTNLPDPKTFPTSSKIDKPSPNTSNLINLHQNVSRSKTSKKQNPKKVILKRKFPGPAGLFPETNAILNQEDNHDGSSFLSSSQLLCSQNSNLTFQEPTWLDMRRDFNESSLLEDYNIEWINNNVADNLINKKVPFLAAIIKQVKNTSKSPIFILADQSGGIEALISTDLYEDYNEYLTSNSVLILRQFGMLSVNPRKHYINITIDNLIRIYSCKSVSDDYVKIVHIQEISNRDLENGINEFVKKYDGLNRLVRDTKTNANTRLHQHTVGTNCLNSNLLTNKQNSKIHEGNILIDHVRSKGDISNKPRNENCNYKSITKTKSNCNLTKEIPSTSLNGKNILEESHNPVDSDIRVDNFKKFNFKNVLHNSKSNEKTTTLLDPKNIFENASEPVDFDLRMDDFEDDFSLPENDQGLRSKSKDDLENYDGDSRKRKIQTISNPAPNIVNKFKDQTKIDVSQISIISQNNNENSNIIKEVFSDLDASVLFDDF